MIIIKRFPSPFNFPQTPLSRDYSSRFSQMTLRVATVLREKLPSPTRGESFMDLCLGNFLLVHLTSFGGRFA